MYSHGLLPAQCEREPLSTGRAGLRDWWDSSYRQELPPVPRLPSCLPCSRASFLQHLQGSCVDLGWGRGGQ